MPRPVTWWAAVVVGLLAVAVVWLAPTSATAQPAPTSTGSPSTTTPATTRPGPLVPPTTAGSRSRVPFPAPPAPGLFDVAGRIRAAVNGWLRDLVAAAIDPAVDLAARSVLATPNLAAPGGRVRELWGLSVGLANAGYVLLVCAGGVLLMTNETLQARYAIKDVAPRLVVLGPGVDPAQARATLKAVLVFPLDDADVWLTLLMVAVVVLALVLGASYVLRVAVLVALIVAGPLALAGHALPQTEALARWWWRGVTACLAIPVAQSLALITALRVFFHADQDRVLGLGSARLVDLLVATCLL
jgi:hypothetical protein